MVCERTNDENGVAFLRAAGKTAAGIFFILSVMLSVAGAGWSLLEGDNVAVCFFWQRR